MSESTSVCFNCPPLCRARCAHLSPIASHSHPASTVIFSHRLASLFLSAQCSSPRSSFPPPIHSEWTSPFCSFPFSSPLQEGERFSAHIPAVLQLGLQPDTRQPGVDEGAARFTEVSHRHPTSSSRLSSRCSANSCLLWWFWGLIEWNKRKWWTIVGEGSICTCLYLLPFWESVW